MHSTTPEEGQVPMSKYAPRPDIVLRYIWSTACLSFGPYRVVMFLQVVTTAQKCLVKFCKTAISQPSVHQLFPTLNNTLKWTNDCFTGTFHCTAYKILPWRLHKEERDGLGK